MEEGGRDMEGDGLMRSSVLLSLVWLVVRGWVAVVAAAAAAAVVAGRLP